MDCNGIRVWGVGRGGPWMVALVLLVGLGAAERAWAQPEAEKSPTVGGVASSAGLGFYFPGKWGLAQSAVENPGDEPIRPRIRFFFEDQRQRQFERRVWVPPYAQRRLTLPVRFDGSVETDGGGNSSTGRSLNTQTVLLAEDTQRDRELDRRSSLGRLVDPEIPFAVVTSRGQPRQDHVVKTLSRVRKRRRLSPRMGYIRDQDLMRFEAAWDGLRALVLAGANPRLDAAQRRALRRWLRAGGTLVVFAHRTDNTIMREMLGEAWGITQVDRVTLNTARFREPGDGAGAATAAGAAEGGRTRSTITVEQPIPMARVIAPGYEARLTVRGWPALLHRSVGRGQIVVSTIGGRAWLHEDARQAVGMLSNTIVKRARRGSGEGLAAEVVRGEPGRRFVSGQIGYQVVSRSTVAMVLGAFIVALAGGTLFWLRSGRLERLGPFGVLVAVLAMGALLVMGQRARRQVPATQAGLQFVLAEPNASRVPVRGAMGLFDGAGRSRTIRSLAGGSAWPPVAREIGGRSRLSVMDLDRLTWRDLSLPPADIRWMEYEGAAQLGRPLKMSLRFGETGLIGELRGPADRTFSDGLLVTHRANLGVPFERVPDEPGRVGLRVGPDEVREPGVLLSEGVIGKTQRERASLLEPLLDRVRFDEPRLLVWSGGLDAGIGVEPSMRSRRHALWAIPLRLEPTPPGQKVRVPWPLVRMQPLFGRADDLGLSMKPIYSDSRGWTERTAGSSAFAARFTMPEAVRPMRLTEAIVHLDMTAIGRPVRILAVKDGQTTVIETIESPDGAVTVAIPPDRLGFGERGGLTVAFDVGAVAGERDGSDPQDIRASQFWTVRYFGLEVAGTKREDE